MAKMVFFRTPLYTIYFLYTIFFRIRNRKFCHICHKHQQTLENKGFFVWQNVWYFHFKKPYHGILPYFCHTFGAASSPVITTNCDPEEADAASLSKNTILPGRKNTIPQILLPYLPDGTFPLHTSLIRLSSALHFLPRCPPLCSLSYVLPIPISIFPSKHILRFTVKIVAPEHFVHVNISVPPAAYDIFHILRTMKLSSHPQNTNLANSLIFPDFAKL